MEILIKNGLVLPMTAKDALFYGDVLIEDGKIKEIGNDIREDAETVINAEGKVILPSFVNAHTHLAMTMMRNYKDDKENLQAWLSEIWPLEAKLNDRNIYYASLLGLAELIKSGCTVYADMYYHAWKTAKATRESSMRAVLGLAMVGPDDKIKTIIREEAPRIDEEIDGYDKIRLDAAPHAIYTCSASSYVLSAEWASERGAALNTHLSETKKEVEDSIKQNGMSPVKYLESLGIFDSVKTYLAHGVFFDDEDVEILKTKKTSIVHNPSSNMKLSSGIAPIAKYKKAGLNVALGTDGASSNNNLNMLKEMNLSALLSSVSTGLPSALPAYDVIKMATIDGAKALSLDDKIGTLEKGKDADLIIMNMDKVNTTPLNDPYSAIVFSADSRNIEYVFSSGKILLDKGELTTIDEEKVKKEVKKEWYDLLKR